MTRPANSLKILLLILIFGATSGSSLAVESRSQSRWPNPRERGMYQAKIASTGKILWYVNWETTVTPKLDHTQRVEIQERGYGQPWRYNRPIVWRKRLVFSTEGQDGQAAPFLRFQSVEGTRWTAEGTLLSHMDIRRSANNRQILYQDSSVGKTDESGVLPWTPQALPDELLFHWVRTLPFGQSLQEQRFPSQCNLVVSPTRQFRINAQVKGTEVVTTPAGTFSCYRVELFPQLVGPLKVLAPKMALWCRTDPPHYWVRYQGPVGGPGSPQAIIELVEFEEQPGR